MKTRRSSMVSIDTVQNQHSMTPNDTWVEVDGGKPTGNAIPFPLDDTGSAQKEIIRQVNQNRNDVTSLAASELLKIARDVMSGMLDEPQYDTCHFPQRLVPAPNEYQDTDPQPDPVSETTHCQCSGNPV